MSDTNEHPGRRALPWLALLLSVIAVVMSAVALLRPSPEPVVASGEYERTVSEVWRLAHAVYGEMELQMPGKLTDAPDTLTEALQPFFDIAQPVIADIEPPTRSGLSSFKGWELYCWPAEPPRDDWNFGLLTGTNRRKLDNEVTREPIHGINDLHTALRELAPGEFIGLLPWKSWADRELIAEIQSMCNELGLEFWSPMDVSLMDEQS